MDVRKTIKAHLPHERLSDKIWSGEEMIPDIREALLEIAESFIDYLGYTIEVLDITMTGSYANYNYTVFSDIDLHILVDMNSIDADIDLVEEFFNAKKSFWNDRHDIKIKGVEVEIYPQDITEEHSSSGVFSLKDNSWIVKPKKFINKMDTSIIEKNANKVIKEIDKVLNNSIKNSSVEDINKFLKKLKKMRSSGLERAGELSNENVIYKIIRSKGLLQKLFDTKYKIEDRLMSVR